MSIYLTRGNVLGMLGGSYGRQRCRTSFICNSTTYTYDLDMAFLKALS